jgi:hypothetical protein
VKPSSSSSSSSGAKGTVGQQADGTPTSPLLTHALDKHGGRGMVSAHAHRWGCSSAVPGWLGGLIRPSQPDASSLQQRREGGNTRDNTRQGGERVIWSLGVCLRHPPPWRPPLLAPP